MPNHPPAPAHEPQYVDIAPSTYLVLAHDLIAETAQAWTAVRILYAMEDHLRNTLGIKDTPLPHLEGVWKLLDPQTGFKNHLNIQGRFMLRQTYNVNNSQLEQAREVLAQQYQQDEDLLALLPHVSLEIQKDGPSICILHVGPYSEESRSFEQMDAFARQHGWRKRGEFHREIYLKDAREVQPQDFHTLLYMYVEKM